MKKMFLLMLMLMVLGAASVNAQVRIGGTIDPDKSAVLDLNKTDADTPAGNLGLSLPRVDLTSATQQLVSGTNPKDGTMVYNTNATFGEGVYVWSSGAWVAVKVHSSDLTGVPGTVKRITHYVPGELFPAAGANPSFDITLLEPVNVNKSAISNAICYLRDDNSKAPVLRLYATIVRIQWPDPQTQRLGGNYCVFDVIEYY
ncbi:hypothetical protein FACS189474_5180 [Bacteroidia bacterium]|nr:hypothetical protein FACS189474_5180 [Bacteroidia bacterium]